MPAELMNPDMYLISSKKEFRGAKAVRIPWMSRRLGSKDVCRKNIPDQNHLLHT